MSARKIRQLRSLKGQVRRAIDTSEDGATVELPIGTARTLLDEIDWMIRDEIEHTHPDDRP